MILRRNAKAAGDLVEGFPRLNSVEKHKDRLISGNLVVPEYAGRGRRYAGGKEDHDV